MIEQLTPTLLSIILLLLVCVASVLTLLVSAILLWRYRRAITRHMDASSGFKAVAPLAHSEPSALRAKNLANGDELYRQAVRGPWLVVMQYAIAGLAFALVFAIAARFVYPYRLGIPGFILAVWFYAWPIVLAALLIMPTLWQRWLIYPLFYFSILLLLVLWAGTVMDIPATVYGAINLPARSSVNPVQTMRLWLLINALPSLLILLCFNRWIRAVAPLVLGLVTMAISGALVAYLGMFSVQGSDVVIALAVSWDISVVWLVLSTIFLALLSCLLLGWLLVRGIALAYRRKKVSDQSLMLDVLWLLFGCCYAMWLVLGGLKWVITAVVAFVAFKLTLILVRRVTGAKLKEPCGLVFLRVFALGRRSDQLLANVTKHWRHIGSVQMITGPDVARSTVQPHQFLDFISGKIASHFVHDEASLERSVNEWDRLADADQRFRINNFFCHADSWQAALSRLVQVNDVVLMDLRSFSKVNDGCIHELQHLVAKVPLRRCLLLVDESTDVSFLESILQQARWALAAESPNCDNKPDKALLYHFSGDNLVLNVLLRQLCNTSHQC